MKITISSDPDFGRELAIAIAKQLSDRLDDLKLIDANQAAQLLGVTVPTFRNIAEREGLRSVDLGERNARWAIADLRDLISRREVKGGAK